MDESKGSDMDHMERCKLLWQLSREGPASSRLDDIVYYWRNVKAQILRFPADVDRDVALKALKALAPETSVEEVAE